MRIGILTYHRTLNYGACLQAVATRIILEKMGYDVYYLDYWPKYHQSKYKIFSWRKLKSLSCKRKIIYIINTLRFYKYKRQRINNFTLFHQRYIFPYCKSTNENFDAIVYGSDQIWREQKETGTYNPIYFGKNSFNTKFHIAYSASMGVLPKSKEKERLVKDLISNLDLISVREQDLLNLLKNNGVDNVSLTIDPTLLLNSSVWDSVILNNKSKEDSYMLVYGIGKSSFDMNEVCNYAKKHGCIVKVLSGNATSRESDTNITVAGPEIFLSLIKNAKCVFTSSFHGLAFSIIYNRDFFASYTVNSNRAETLLNSLNISHRLLPPHSPIPEIESIDYVQVNKDLDVLRQNSISYLGAIRTLFENK